MSKKVLVADDNRDAADSLVVLLDWLGYEAIACYDGAQAVQLARTFRPDLVILDINMPVMDGYEAAKVLRGGHEQNRMVLIALTAVVTPEARDKALKAGFDIHLRKPVDGSELTGLLERVLH